MSALRYHVREWGPTWLFGISIIGGALIIWFGKLYDANIFLVTAVPVGLMLLYAAMNGFLSGLRVRNEQTGDNLYYMGFVYTLVSLGISLYKFTGEASIEDIVKNFGIAIISTVTGILLRILFNQMRRDPADIERAVRTELSELTRKVRTELDSSALEFSSYRRTSNQMLSEGFEEIARQAEKNGEAVRAAIEAMSLKATQTLQDTADRLVVTLEQTHRQISEIAEKNVATSVNMTERLEAAVEKLTARAEGLGDAIDTVTRKYASARSPEEILRIDVTPAVEALRLVVDNNVKAMSENAAGTRDAAKKVLSAIAPFKQTSINLNQLVGKLEQVNETSDRSAEALAGVLSRVSDAVTATTDATKAQASATEQIGKLIDTVSAVGNTAVKMVEEQNRAHAERIERILSSLTTEASNGERMTISLEPNVEGSLSAAAEPSVEVDDPSPVPDTSSDKEEKSRWSIFQR
jgi:methyl-accepting chemotaxis protein